MPCVSGQGQNLSQGLGQVGLERQGLTRCQGPNAGNPEDDTRFGPYAGTEVETGCFRVG